MMLGNQMVSPAVAFSKVRQTQRADGLASVLSIGTAVPPNCVLQEEYADYYFHVTQTLHHRIGLKEKLHKLCQNTGIKKRYFYHTEEMIQGHPEFLNRASPSLDARMDILATAVPELASAAAAKAIAEWGRPAAEITHLIVSTYSSGGHMPGADFRLATLLGLPSSVQRTMLYMYGCTGTSAALRAAKDIAENNGGARVLVACADLTLMLFRAPDEARNETLKMQSMFSDGAGAVVVGAEAQPKFELVSASQAMAPAGELDGGVGQLRENGLLFHPSRNIPAVIHENLERWVSDAVAPLGISPSDWNELFFAVQPGGRAMLDSLAASRRVLAEYGNMSGPSLVFVLQELQRSKTDREIGVMLGLGPGLDVEAMVLRATGKHY
ncbi:hypothetical protein BDA96_08G014800 [Sorghum bicolor]|uniref:Chalcone synthase n=2 Tax=Sorghum bicolor TaxID=4558 RepID=A0A921QCI5_SORBI|nr:hypothetical protein SORBI_3008G013500 [Sorghum bicolor]KAG0519764.1 hypothetical protein BDA96_08G014800 [Sorghum bicolor]